jgi:hypothetical protein
MTAASKKKKQLPGIDWSCQWRSTLPSRVVSD